MKCAYCKGENCRIIEETSPLEGWKIACAILLFPIGLIFLFMRTKKNVKYCPDCGKKENM